MSNLERSAQEWFQDAARWYIEGHQGCPWCGGSNRVYRTQRGGRIEYHCGNCEFYVCQELDTGRHVMAPGLAPRGKAPPTMHVM